MSSTRRHFTGRTSLALPALGAALALVVTSCSASTDSAVSGTVVSSSGSASASASATSTQELFPTLSASPSASASASSPAPAPSVVTITVHAEPTASESKNADPKSDLKKDSTCASDSASTVVSKALRNLKNKSRWDQWTNVSSTYEGYDPCAELSWLTRFRVLPRLIAVSLRWRTTFCCSTAASSLVPQPMSRTHSPR